MARPRKGDEKLRPNKMGFRVMDWVREGIDQVAKDKALPLSDVAHEAFVAYLKRHGIKEPKA
jgi:hypothetical protein